MSYYTEQICNNEYAKSLVLYNSETKKYFQMKCKSYSCPKHGFIMRERLQKAIQKWLESHKIIRFWTFTIRKTEELSVNDFNINFKKVWHRFITELRRNKALTKRERNLQYVKVYEVHKSGCLHIHLFATEYVHWNKLQSIWDYAVARHFVHSGKKGNVHTKRFVSPHKAAHYISKYVTKIALQVEVKVKAWSKSGKVAIFPKRIASSGWFLIRKDSIEYLHLKMGIPILVGITPPVTECQPKKTRPPPHPKLFVEQTQYFAGQMYHLGFSLPPITKETHRTHIESILGTCDITDD